LFDILPSILNIDTFYVNLANAYLFLHRISKAQTRISMMKEFFYFHMQFQQFCNFLSSALRMNECYSSHA